MNVSTLETGAFKVAPRTISGKDIWLADLADPINILLQTHLLSLDKVQAFSV